ncbi:MAG: hypothetical protein AB6733_04365 [Clostridiaceae bacterium]
MDFIKIYNISGEIHEYKFYFVFVYSVRLAINPLLNKHNETITEDKDLGLVKLRDIDVLSNPELEEVIELYQKKSIRLKLKN